MRPSLCQGPANFILIGHSLGWDQSAWLSLSIRPSCLCSTPCPLCSFSFCLSLSLFAAFKTSRLFLQLVTTSSLCLISLSPLIFFLPICCRGSSLPLSLMPFIDIALVRMFSNFCSPSPVDLTFHQTKQIALMLSANKKLHATALIHTQWHEREMWSCSIRVNLMAEAWLSPSFYERVRGQRQCVRWHWKKWKCCANNKGWWDARWPESTEN